MLAKSRNVLIGWKDPMIYQLERRAPTPTQEAIMVLLQWLASFKVSGRISDLTNAFGQSRRTNRETKLATELPRGVKHPSVPQGCLLKVETELYGLVSGPSWLRASLSMDLQEAGYVKNHYDRCMYTLPSKNGKKSSGQVLLDVDDFIEGGDDRHRKVMDKFYEKYKCGKAVDLVAAGDEGTLFAGRRISQDRKFNIKVTMNEYVDSKLSKIEVPRGYIKDTKAVSDGMITKLKGVNGALGWLASTGRPDMAAVHSIIPGGYEARQTSLITDVNAAVAQCQSTPITIRIWHRDPEDLRWTCFTDSGFDTSEKARHQQG